MTAAMFQAMRDALAEQKKNPLSIDDVTAMIAGQIGQLAPMDEETADLFQKLLKKVMNQKMTDILSEKITVAREDNHERTMAGMGNRITESCTSRIDLWKDILIENAMKGYGKFLLR